VSELSLVEFLTARLDEDEAVARAAGGEHWYWSRVRKDDEEPIILDSPSCLVSYEIVNEGYADHAARWSPALVLAEVEAKRRIVDECANAAAWAASPDCDAPLSYSTMAGVLLGALRHLASVYSDHPDYREEWTP
jgi:hypothetical protein